MTRFIVTIALVTAFAGPAASGVPLFTRVEDTGLPTVGKSFGGTMADVDGDRRPDLFLSRHGSGTEIYLNRGDLRFELLVTEIGLPDAPVDNHGAAAADFDGDGDWDFYISGGTDLSRIPGINSLLVQEAPGIFLEGIDAAHLLADPRGKGRGALWLDLDGDRYLELLLLHYSSPIRLFHFADDTWHDWSDRVCVSRPEARKRFSWAGYAACGDLDGDRNCDIFHAGGEWSLLRNTGDGHLVDVTTAAGLPERDSALADAVLGDVDGDGDLDLLTVRRVPPTLDLWWNESDAGAIRLVPGGAVAELSRSDDIDSVLLADLDNDGTLDLYIARFAGDSNLANLAAKGSGDGTFHFQADAWGAGAPVASMSSGAWPIDLDDDGDLDLMLVHGRDHHPERDGLVEVYRNETTNTGFTLQLETTGGPAHGLGAVVTVQVGEKRLARQVRSVGNPWNSTVLPLHFGVGMRAAPFTAGIVWPDGRQQIITIPAAGAAWVLREGTDVVQRR